MLSSLFGFSAPCQIDIKFNRVEGRKNASLRDSEGTKYKAPVFTDGEDVRGKVAIEVKSGSRIEHQGIRVELVGVIENLFDKN